MLGQDVSNTPEALARVRQAMLALIDKHCVNSDDIQRRVIYATDIDALWYLRSNLMAAISANRGEAVAHDCITQITILFQRHQAGGKQTQAKGSSLRKSNDEQT